MEFAGFERDDFAVFEIDGFAERMPQLRGRITPKLKALAALITPEMTRLTGHTMFPHVALHMRRTVNPPEATWAAFARNGRAYKPYAHFRVVASIDGLKVTSFMEDEADDKAILASGLVRNAAALKKFFMADPAIQTYDHFDVNGEPCSASTLSKKEISAFGERLGRVKGQHASFGILLGSSPDVVGSPEILPAAIMEAAGRLLPLYRLGMEPKFKL